MDIIPDERSAYAIRDILPAGERGMDCCFIFILFIPVRLLMIKQAFRKWLQAILGYERYLFCFALVQVYRIRLFGARDFVAFSAQLPPAGILLDIGANLGITAVLLAKAHPRSLIYAFEPIPENVVAMERVCRYFGLKNIRIRELALGNTKGVIEMLVPRSGDAWMQGLAQVIDPGHDKPIPGRRLKVKMRQLDDPDLLPIKNERITGIKLDVENYEWYVLQGGRQLIARHRPLIFCELWNDERKGQCIGLLQQLGYEAYVMEKRRWVRYKGQDCLDYLFVPEPGTA